VCWFGLDVRVRNFIGNASHHDTTDNKWFLFVLIKSPGDCNGGIQIVPCSLIICQETILRENSPHPERILAVIGPVSTSKSIIRTVRIRNHGGSNAKWEWWRYCHYYPMLLLPQFCCAFLLSSTSKNETPRKESIVIF
jgi:hypothetical protein